MDFWSISLITKVLLIPFSGVGFNDLGTKIF